MSSSDVCRAKIVESGPFQLDLTGLPLDVFLCIIDMLDDEWKVLLSLTCKRMRSTMRSSLAIPLPDRSARIRLLQHLDLDFPEHITCVRCTRMYPWRNQNSTSFQCRRLKCVPDRFAWAIRLTRFSSIQKDLVMMNRELVDLISRAQQRGPRYGRPISYLNVSGICSTSNVAMTVKARWIENQLVVKTQRENHMPPDQDAVDEAFCMGSGVCAHGWPSTSDLMRRTWSFRERQAVGAGEGLVFKCSYCLTDTHVCIAGTPLGYKKVVLETWQNFGSRTVRSRGTEQIFKYWDQSTMLLNHTSVLSRDLHALFDSGSDEPSTQES